MVLKQNMDSVKEIKAMWYHLKNKDHEIEIDDPFKNKNISLH